MTDIIEKRIALKCLKKAVKHLRISNKYIPMSNEWETHWKLYKYYRGIFTAHYTAHEKTICGN